MKRRWMILALCLLLALPAMAQAEKFDPAQAGVTAAGRAQQLGKA